MVLMLLPLSPGSGKHSIVSDIVSELATVQVDFSVRCAS